MLKLKYLLKIYKKVKMVKYPNFISTSIQENWEKEENNLNLDVNKVQVIIKAKVEKDTHCGYLDEELSWLPSEKEILVLRNAVLFIVDVKYIEEYNQIKIIGIFKGQRKEGGV